MSDRLLIVANRHGFKDILDMLEAWKELTPTQIKDKFGVSLSTISNKGVFKRTSPMKVYSQEEVANIRQSLEQGMLVKDIAVKMGISRQWVQEIMRRNNLSARGVKGTKKNA